MTTGPSEQVCADFLAGLSSPATRAAYRREIACATAFLQTQGVTLLEAERRHLQRYVAHCQDRGLAPRTTARRLAALSGFFGYACAEGLLPQSPMLLLRRPRVPTDQVRRALDVTEAQRLLQAAADHSPRGHALVALLLGTGLRISAVCTASVTDIVRGAEMTTLTYRNKGGGRAVTVLSDLVLEAVDSYLLGRTSGPLLATAGRVGRLDRVGAHRLLKQITNLALPHRCDVSAHSLRSTFCQLSLLAGASLQDTSYAMAHIKLASTQPYLAAALALEHHPAHLLADYLRPHPVRDDAYDEDQGAAVGWRGGTATDVDLTPGRAQQTRRDVPPVLGAPVLQRRLGSGR